MPIERIKYKNFENLQFKFNVDLDYQTGTYIYLPNLKRNITEKTLSSLRLLLPRRFQQIFYMIIIPFRYLLMTIN